MGFFQRPNSVDGMWERSVFKDGVDRKVRAKTTLLTILGMVKLSFLSLPWGSGACSWTLRGEVFSVLICPPIGATDFSY
jgi:hypothetical protein